MLTVWLYTASCEMRYYSYIIYFVTLLSMPLTLSEFYYQVIKYELEEIIYLIILGTFFCNFIHNLCSTIGCL